jgi:hypothetical protein
MLVKRKDPFRTMAGSFLLVDTGTRVAAPTGITTHNAGHHHGYDVDENGNGYTTIAYHPENKEIRHRHKVVNWTIQSAKSQCYPKCRDIYGVEGAPPHAHQITSKRFMSKIRKPEQIARRMLKTMDEEDRIPTAPQATETQTLAQAPPPQPVSAPSPQSSSPAQQASPTIQPMVTGGGGSSGGY